MVIILDLLNIMTIFYHQPTGNRENYQPRTQQHQENGAGTLTGHNSSVTRRDMGMTHVSSISSTQWRSESHIQNYE